MFLPKRIDVHIVGGMLKDKTIKKITGQNALRPINQIIMHNLNIVMASDQTRIMADSKDLQMLYCLCCILQSKSITIITI